MTPSARALAAEIHQQLLSRAETVGTVESLTAGLVGATLTSVPGASATYRGGLIVYATDLKATLAGVPDDLLADRGPVDPDVARALASGARERLRSSWALGLTGVAGPDPQGGQPVGTLHIGLAGPGGSSVTSFTLTGDRDGIRSGAVEAGLLVLRDSLAEAE